MKLFTALLPLVIGLLPWLGRPAGADARPRYWLTVLPIAFQNFDALNYIRIAGGGINNKGQIAGWLASPSGRLGDYRVVIWQKGHPLRLLDKAPVTTGRGEEDPSNRNYTFATAINGQGEVIGGNYLTFSGAYSGVIGTAYLWHSGLMAKISGFPDDADGMALGLNDRGQIVGDYAYNPHTLSPADPPPPSSDFGDHAFLVRGGHVLTL